MLAHRRVAERKRPILATPCPTRHVLVLKPVLPRPLTGVFGQGTEPDATVASMAYWWDAKPDERYWCEITDREDIGADLKCPQTNEAGGEYWSYSFINDVSTSLAG
jgi:hypothetical protein